MSQKLGGIHNVTWGSDVARMQSLALSTIDGKHGRHGHEPVPLQHVLNRIVIRLSNVSPGSDLEGSSRAPVGGLCLVSSLLYATRYAHVPLDLPTTTAKPWRME
ncbi:hypothetical protein FRB91_004475 [Serendipita sp. 411]|nr:hypothetical protein FRB91_004475 [Serendipita sp. 411]